ncbi:PspC domain-containing protein [Paenibacillus agri]|uniref:PspC domain-containing protein n=1 Tax=Paenibacillus agri TaxID=2744309 RepID=A0A850EMJ1_9BACL|nr:PspC domain-containing protein [Paenibacillus agri]NUU60584.1 PspC domain-containing protein [Paenibacillus agri]
MTKFYRSRNDKKLSGLCGGIAQWLGIDATILRVITVVGAFFSFGTVALLYIILSILVPQEPYGNFSDKHDFY